MSCTVTSASSNSGSDWVDIPIPSQPITFTVSPEGGTWTVEKLQLAMSELLSELSETVDVLGYSEIKYCILSNMASANRYASSYGYIDPDLVEAVMSQLTDYYSTHTAETYMRMGTGFLRLYNTEYFYPLDFKLYNDPNNSVKLQLTCNLCTVNTTSICIVLKGRK